MAATFVAASTAHSATSVGALGIVLPSSVQAGDDIVVIATATADVGWTTPAGYSINGAAHTRGTSLGSIVYRKTAVGGDASATVTVDPDSTQRISVIALVLRGTNGADVSATVDDGNDSSIVCPTLTAAIAGDMLIRVGTQRIPSGSTSNNWVTPSGYSSGSRAQSISTFSSNANAAAVAYWAIRASTGNVGTATIGSQFSGVWISYTVAIKPTSSSAPVSLTVTEPITVQEIVDVVTPPPGGVGTPVDVVTLGDDSLRSMTFIKSMGETVDVGELVVINTVVPPPPGEPPGASTSRFLLGPAATPRTRELALPFRVDPVRGRFAIAQDPAEQLAHHVLSVLGTQVGERAMRPAYGSNLVAFQFAPVNDPLLVAQMQDAISRALSLSCPEVRLVKVEVVPPQDGADKSSYTVNVHFEPASGGALTVASLQVGVVQPSGTVRDTGF